MITKEIVFKIARLHKSHGIKGEISIEYDHPEYADIDVDFYFMEIDTTFIPFRIEEINFMSDARGRVKFEDIDDETKASKFSNIDIYILREEMPHIDNDNNQSSWDWFIGFEVIDQQNANLGVIEQVDDSTINILFVVKKEDTEHLIPATEDFISEIYEENKIIYLNLPEGLIEE